MFSGLWAVLVRGAGIQCFVTVKVGGIAALARFGSRVVCPGDDEPPPTSAGDSNTSLLAKKRALAVA